MCNKTHILVVDDEPDLREMVDEYLTQQGFQVTTAANGTILRHLLEQQPVDLVLLDIRMPGEDGLSLARFIREHYTAGIIMVTAAGAVVDRVVGLEVGADDYISKPFDPRELLARIKSVLRRLAAPPAEPPTPADVGSRIPVGRCLLDVESHRLFEQNGNEIPLTSMEFDLLHAFVTHPNRVLTRDQLLELAHHRGWEPFDRSIDIRITRIRRKIEADPAKPQAIKTVHGKGYLFAPATGAKLQNP